MKTEAPLVSLRQVNKTWTVGLQQVAVLRNITLDVHRGESLALVGPSGAGKSTLLHVIALLTPIDNGELWMNGQTVDPSHWWDPELRQSIGMVFQDGKLLPNLSVIDNVCVPLVHRGLWPAHQRKLAVAALEAVGVAHRQRHHPNQLSGGELMRVTIARALVMNPSLILADEPTGTLDSANGEQIARLLFGLVSTKRALVIVTHHAPLAAQADRVIALRDGRMNHE